MSLGKTLIDNARSKFSSQRKLADAIGVDQGYLSRVAAGQKPISPAVATQLAQFAGVDPIDAACAAVIEAEVDPVRRTELARLLRVPVAAVIGAAALLAGGNSHANQTLAIEQVDRLCIM